MLVITDWLKLIINPFCGAKLENDAPFFLILCVTLSTWQEEQEGSHLCDNNPSTGGSAANQPTSRAAVRDEEEEEEEEESVSVILLAQQQDSCGCKAASHDSESLFFYFYLGEHSARSQNWVEALRMRRDKVKWNWRRHKITAAQPNLRAGQCSFIALRSWYDTITHLRFACVVLSWFYRLHSGKVIKFRNLPDCSLCSNESRNPRNKLALCTSSSRFSKAVGVSA